MIEEVAEDHFSHNGEYIEYSSLEAAKEAIDEHARNLGYMVVKAHGSKKRGYLGYCYNQYQCCQRGKYEGHPLKNTGTRRNNCRFELNVTKKCGSDNSWKIKVVMEKHNHGPVSSLSSLPEERQKNVKKYSKLID